MKPEHLSEWVKCEICTHNLGFINEARVGVPITGGMFTSPDPIHGFPDPFPPSIDWIDMRCPMCRKRPFLKDYGVHLSNGEFVDFRTKWERETEKKGMLAEIQEQKEPEPPEGTELKCPVCGKQYKRQKYFEDHMAKGHS